MPRTISDIVEHGDELARRFEDYEPREADQRPAETFTGLRDAVLARARAESTLAAAVAQARHDGYSWRSIGSVIGTSGEAARQRYGAPLPA